MEPLNGEKLLFVFYREHFEVEKWMKQVWIDHLEGKR